MTQCCTQAAHELGAWWRAGTVHASAAPTCSPHIPPFPLTVPAPRATRCVQVRLKKFLEMRGADGGPWRMLCALPALWVGLIYDDEAQKQVGLGLVGAAGGVGGRGCRWQRRHTEVRRRIR